MVAFSGRAMQRNLFEYFKVIILFYMLFVVAFSLKLWNFQTQVCLFSSHVMPVIQFQRRSIFLVQITKLSWEFCIRDLEYLKRFFQGLNNVLLIRSFCEERQKFPMDCFPDNIVHRAAREVFHFRIVWEFLLTS